MEHWLNVDTHSAGPGWEHFIGLLELVNQLHLNLYLYLKLL